MTNKQELRKYIDTISEEDAKAILLFLKRFVSPIKEGEPLTQDEKEAFDRADEEMVTGQFLTIEEFEKGARL